MRESAGASGAPALAGVGGAAATDGLAAEGATDEAGAPDSTDFLSQAASASSAQVAIRTVVRWALVILNVLYE